MSYHLGPIAPDQRPELFADPRDDEPRPRSHRVLGAALALLVMALFAGGLWFAYVKGTRHAGSGAASGEVPLIRADERPTKVKPERPGGMEIPDRDNLIYNPPRRAVEHLLPPPEKPLPRPTAPSAQAGRLPRQRLRRRRHQQCKPGRSRRRPPRRLRRERRQRARLPVRRASRSKRPPHHPVPQHRERRRRRSLSPARSLRRRVELGFSSAQCAARTPRGRNGSDSSGKIPTFSAAFRQRRSAPISVTREYITAFRRHRWRIRLPPSGSATS